MSGDETGRPRSGTVALVGRPNAGKSTLLNRLLDEKIAIVSESPQTTRHRIIGVLTAPRGQIVFFDTPGIHRPLHRLNRRMVDAAREALQEADLICVLHDASSRFGAGDAYLLELVRRAPPPRLMLLNKVDKIRKQGLLPLMQRFGETQDFDEILPISALTGEGCDALLSQIWRRLPEGERLVEGDWSTVHSTRFLAAERIRECVLRETRDELPYVSAVRIDEWQEPRGDDRAVEIDATVLVEKSGQRGIMIGRRGRKIRQIGTAARIQLEDLLDQPVVLRLHVKVESDWREDRRVLADLDRDLLGRYASLDLKTDS